MKHMPKMLGLLAATSIFALSGFAPAYAAPAHVLPAAFVAHDHGAADPRQVINVTVRLTLRDEDGFRRAVDALYDRKSPTFHHWMTDADLARFAPSAEQREAVRRALEAQGLHVVSVDRNGFTLRARGAIGDMNRAFDTEIHQFDRNGTAYRAPVRPAQLKGVEPASVKYVSGLESHVVRPTLVRSVNAETHKPYRQIRAREFEKAGGFASIITDKALSPTQTITYTTPGASLPTATYSGIQYDENIALAVDFTSHQLEAAYGLPKAYAAGIDGTGQTIVLLEGYGYPTIQADANLFSKYNKLPALTSANFSIVYPEGAPAPDAGILTGWNGEIALDVQWAHSIAPNASIVVVATNGQDNEDFQASMQYIIDNSIGYTVSDSWEEDTDLVAGPVEQESYEDILTVAAAKGISFQFSTGDGGDGGLGTPIGAPGVPSVAPHATAVGGTALLNVLGRNDYQSVGWGDAFAVLDIDGPYDPPFSFFNFGGGGGESVYWPKPVWQATLPGVGRQTPDVSALADPYTGVPIVLTDSTQNNEQFIEVGVGGTSLASPIFTAFWALANQKAGQPLGLAGPTIAGLKKGLVDVLPLSSPNNLAGSITDANGTTNYTAASLFAGLVPAGETFTAALWNIPSYSEAEGVAFGVDSSLTVTPGWDNATGYGTPYGLGFINAAAAYGTK